MNTQNITKKMFRKSALVLPLLLISAVSINTYAAKPSPSGDKRVFLSSITIPTGDLRAEAQRLFNVNVGNDGLKGGDAICNGLAKSAGLSGNYVAWLSRTGTDAKDRISEGRFYILVGTKKVQIAASKADLIDGKIDFPQFITDEKGNSALDRFPVGAETPETFNTSDVWTGTTNIGALSSSNCSNWTSASGNDTGVVGFAETTNCWSDGTATVCGFEASDKCDTGGDLPNHLYCVEK